MKIANIIEEMLNEGARAHDWVEQYGEIGQIHKVRGRAAYVKFPSTKDIAFDVIELASLKKTGKKHKGKDLYLSEGKLTEAHKYKKGDKLKVKRKGEILDIQIKNRGGKSGVVGGELYMAHVLSGSIKGTQIPVYQKDLIEGKLNEAKLPKRFTVKKKFRVQGMVFNTGDYAKKKESFMRGKTMVLNMDNNEILSIDYQDYIAAVKNGLIKESKLNEVNIKGMQKIKVNGLKGHMPGVDYVYYDKKSKKYWFSDFEGDPMELKNISTLKVLANHMKSTRQTLEGKLNEGKIKHIDLWFEDRRGRFYKVKINGGRAPREWDGWSNAQDSLSKLLGWEIHLRSMDDNKLEKAAKQLKKQGIKLTWDDAMDVS